MVQILRTYGSRSYYVIVPSTTLRVLRSDGPRVALGLPCHHTKCPGYLARVHLELVWDPWTKFSYESPGVKGNKNGSALALNQDGECGGFMSYVLGKVKSRPSHALAVA